jgi:hypothetical protein
MAKAPFDRDWHMDLAHTDVRGEEIWLFYSPRNSFLLESTDGNYITRNGVVVKWGEYSDAIPDVRYADFDEMGYVSFSSVAEARLYISKLIGERLKGARRSSESLTSTGVTP